MEKAKALVQGEKPTLPSAEKKTKQKTAAQANNVLEIKTQAPAAAAASPEADATLAEEEAMVLAQTG